MYPALRVLPTSLASTAIRCDLVAFVGYSAPAGQVAQSVLTHTTYPFAVCTIVLQSKVSPNSRCYSNHAQIRNFITIIVVPKDTHIKPGIPIIPKSIHLIPRNRRHVRRPRLLHHIRHVRMLPIQTRQHRISARRRLLGRPPLSIELIIFPVLKGIALSPRSREPPADEDEHGDGHDAEANGSALDLCVTV